MSEMLQRSNNNFQVFINEIHRNAFFWLLFITLSVYTACPLRHIILLLNENNWLYESLFTFS